ncbi:hypothetical protein [uncultured Aureimonas sp.]|uniref:hypothetical protein n=1 Tax=uncultured Aureimonas sp. TaxID=1604662 RepID=UPI0025F4D6AF|nr:hypothetical protein [uncultured Aureimonas sp.]
MPSPERRAMSLRPASSASPGSARRAACRVPAPRRRISACRQAACDDPVRRLHRKGQLGQRLGLQRPGQRETGARPGDDVAFAGRRPACLDPHPARRARIAAHQRVRVAAVEFGVQDERPVARRRVADGRAERPDPGIGPRGIDRRSGVEDLELGIDRSDRQQPEMGLGGNGKSEERIARAEREERAPTAVELRILNQEDIDAPAPHQGADVRIGQEARVRAAALHQAGGLAGRAILATERVHGA